MSVLDEFRLNGEATLVTGAAGGIGGGFAEAVAEAGANVALAESTKRVSKRPLTVSAPTPMRRCSPLLRM